MTKEENKPKNSVGKVDIPPPKSHNGGLLLLSPHVQNASGSVPMYKGSNAMLNCVCATQG